jgi:hypothetical protein
MKNYANAKTNEPLDYVVVNENTLAYIFKSEIDTLYFGILAGSVKRNGYQWIDGPRQILASDRIRYASQDDFLDYRVLSCGLDLQGGNDEDFS